MKARIINLNHSAILFSTASSVIHEAYPVINHVYNVISYVLAIYQQQTKLYILKTCEWSAFHLNEGHKNRPP